MIRSEQLADVKRLSPGFQDPMLMLGAQELLIAGYERHEGARWFVETFGITDYTTLDLCDGDLKLDLNSNLGNLDGKYGSVVNYGTVEHVWNVHAAWCNTLRAVAPGGWLLSHTPVAGWCTAEGYLDHGLHLTLRSAILEFIELNGFRIVDVWDTKWRDRGRIMWFRAQKVRHIRSFEDFTPPLQVRGLSPTYRSVA